MARNIEIKAVVRDREYVARFMKTHGSQFEVQHQRDVFFHCARGRLKLRCFPDGSGVLVAYERPDVSGPKLSNYILTPVADSAPLEASLAATLGVRGVIEKHREIAIIGQTRVHLDEVSGLGTFLELEVVLRDDQAPEDGQRIAAELMEKLKVASADLVDRAYMDLLESRR